MITHFLYIVVTYITFLKREGKHLETILQQSLDSQTPCLANWWLICIMNTTSDKTRVTPKVPISSWSWHRDEQDYISS